MQEIEKIEQNRNFATKKRKNKTEESIQNILHKISTIHPSIVS